VTSAPLDLGQWFASTAHDGSMLLAIPVALVAGLVSFFSPCVVPLLPGYLSYTTGLSGADLADARRGRMLAGSLLFVLGFSFVFVSFGALMGAVGDWLFTYQRPITVVLGIFVILLGLVFLGVVPWMQRDVRIHRVPAVGLLAAPLLGVLFGLGWTPCIGPTLSAVTSLALNEASAGRGALLSFVYCLGLGLPFIIRGRVDHEPVGSKFLYHETAFLPLGASEAAVDHILIVGVQIPEPFWDISTENLTVLADQLRVGALSATSPTAR